MQLASEEFVEVGRHLRPPKKFNQLGLAYLLTRGSQSMGILILNVGH